MEFIDLQTQRRRISQKLNERIQSVLENGHFIMGPEVGELETKLATFVGVKHAISCANGTDALMLSMMALQIGLGDEVITTPFSFAATAETIAILGAKPVFVDIENETYNIDARLIERAITKKTKAVIPVSLYGQCADLDAINALAEKHSLAVIEDAAQSFGATYKGKRSGSLSTISCTSFFPSKPLGCYGDGGACFTNDDLLAARLKQIRVHGQDKRYHHPVVGVNSRLDTLQAAILLAKFEIFEDEILKRQSVARTYSEKLSKFVQTPKIQAERSSVFAQYTIQVENREGLATFLKQREIPTAIHYPIPLHLQPAFANPVESRGSLPISERISKRVISLPMHPYLSETDQSKVIQAITDYLEVEKHSSLPTKGASL